MVAAATMMKTVWKIFGRKDSKYEAPAPKAWAEGIEVKSRPPPVDASQDRGREHRHKASSTLPAMADAADHSRPAPPPQSRRAVDLPKTGAPGVLHTNQDSWEGSMAQLTNAPIRRRRHSIGGGGGDQPLRDSAQSGDAPPQLTSGEPLSPPSSRRQRRKSCDYGDQDPGSPATGGGFPRQVSAQSNASAADSFDLNADINGGLSRRVSGPEASSPSEPMGGFSRQVSAPEARRPSSSAFSGADDVRDISKFSTASAPSGPGGARNSRGTPARRRSNSLDKNDWSPKKAQVAGKLKVDDIVANDVSCGFKRTAQEFHKRNDRTSDWSNSPPQSQSPSPRSNRDAPLPALARLVRAEDVSGDYAMPGVPAERPSTHGKRREVLRSNGRMPRQISGPSELIQDDSSSRGSPHASPRHSSAQSSPRSPKFPSGRPLRSVEVAMPNQFMGPSNLRVDWRGD